MILIPLAFLQVGQELFPNISPSGEVKSNAGESLGNFEFYTPKKAILAAAYLYFFDLGWLQSGVKSLVSAPESSLSQSKQRLERKSTRQPSGTLPNQFLPTFVKCHFRPRRLSIFQSCFSNLMNDQNITPLIRCSCNNS